ncbi:MAG: hypothetical protein SVO26_08750 [Chloroflexota bacterium]|nr:hypothetical protein [Chloroflexota bacterium]
MPDAVNLKNLLTGKCSYCKGSIYGGLGDPPFLISLDVIRVIDIWGRNTYTL